MTEANFVLPDGVSGLLGQFVQLSENFCLPNNESAATVALEVGSGRDGGSANLPLDICL